MLSYKLRGERLGETSVVNHVYYWLSESRPAKCSFKFTGDFDGSGVGGEKYSRGDGELGNAFKIFKEGVFLFCLVWFFGVFLGRVEREQLMLRNRWNDL